MSWKDRSQVVTGNSDWKSRSLPADEDFGAESESPGILGSIKDGASEIFSEYVVPAAKAVDSVTGAPTRAAIQELQKDWKNIPEAASRFANQFAENPDLAPTGKDLARPVLEGIGVNPDASLSEKLPGLFNKDGKGLQLEKGGWADITAAGAAGLPLDFAADPTTYVGVGALAKGAGKLGQGAAKVASKVDDVVRPAVRQLAETAIERTARQIPEGLKQAADIAKKSARGVGEFVSDIANPKIADDWADTAAFARSQGIDPAKLSESVEFGPSSFVSRASRNFREGPLGQKALESFQEGRGAIEEAAERFTGKVASGPVPDRISAGEMIKEGLADKSYLGQNDNFYSTLNKTSPGARLGDKARKRLDDVLIRAHQKASAAARGGDAVAQAQAKEVLDYIDRISKADGSYESLNEIRQGLGKALNRKPIIGQAPLDQELYGQLYGGLKKSMTREFGERMGPESLRELLKKNREIRSQSRLRKPFEPMLGQAGESVFDSVFLRGNSKQVEALGKVLKPETMQRLKGAALNEILQKARTGDNSISFKSALNEMRRRRDVMGRLYSPEELNTFQRILELGERHGPDVLSSSGTGASNMFKDLVQNIQNQVLNQNVIENLKNRARGPKIPPAAESGKLLSLPAPVAESARVAPELVPDKAASIGGRLKDAGFAARKGLQMLSTQSPLSEETLRLFQANPAMLEQIQSDSLREKIAKLIQERSVRFPSAED